MDKMKVFIVIEGFDYEGFTDPNKVFDSYEKASNYRNELLKENDFTGYHVDIYEMEVL